MAWAILPWAWRALRRLSRRESGVFWAFACSYLIVTIGYVHGTLMLAVMYIAVLVGGLATGQQRRGLLAVLGCGALTALVTITVYLPSALTADVTVRAQRGITNSDFLSPDLAGIVSSVSPEALTVLPGWWPDGYAPRRSSTSPGSCPCWRSSTGRRLVATLPRRSTCWSCSRLTVLRARPERHRATPIPRPAAAVRGTERHRARRRPPGAGARPARHDGQTDRSPSAGWPWRRTSRGPDDHPPGRSSA